MGFFRVLYVNDSIFILFESKYEGSRKESNEQICWLMAVGAENKTHHQKLCDLKSFLLYFQEMHDLFVGFSVKPRTSLRPFPRICRCYGATYITWKMTSFQWLCLSSFRRFCAGNKWQRIYLHKKKDGKPTIFSS